MQNRVAFCRNDLRIRLPARVAILGLRRCRAKMGGGLHRIRICIRIRIRIRIRMGRDKGRTGVIELEDATNAMNCLGLYVYCCEGMERTAVSYREIGSWRV